MSSLTIDREFVPGSIVFRDVDQNTASSVVTPTGASSRGGTAALGGTTTGTWRVAATKVGTVGSPDERQFTSAMTGLGVNKEETNRLWDEVSKLMGDFVQIETPALAPLFSVVVASSTGKSVDSWFLLTGKPENFYTFPGFAIFSENTSASAPTAELGISLFPPIGAGTVHSHLGGVIYSDTDRDLVTATVHDFLYSEGREDTCA